MATRRDRHGRGLRGPLAPSGLPLARTRAEVFDDLVLASLDRLDSRWASELDSIEVIVADVPDVDRPELGLGAGGQMPLGRAEAASAEHGPRLVIHRRAIEARARKARAREELVHRVVVEQLADLLGLGPDQVDPDLSDPEP
jgi:predicted Zn-dependent protease with MMP-like domain